MDMHPVATIPMHVNRWTNGWTDMTMLTGTFCENGNMPQKCHTVVTYANNLCAWHAQ